MTTPALRRIPTCVLLLVGLLLALAAHGGSVADAQTAPTTVTPTPWIVLRCQFLDDPLTPGATPVLDDLFTSSGAGKGGMVDYWRDMSGGAVDLTGSTVAPGWYRMTLSLSTALEMVWPAAREDVITSCINAADPTVDFRPFFGIVVATNSANVDAGSVGPSNLNLDGTTRRYGLVHLDPGAWTNTFAAHEMGHGYGLDDSFSSGMRYGDGWDIMSAFTFGGLNPTFQEPTSIGQSGPGLSGALRDVLGWIPPADRIHLNTLSLGSTVTLSALDGGPPGRRIVRVWLGRSNHYYVVEFRTKQGWDRAIARDAVQVRRMYSGSSTSSLVRATNGTPDLQAGDIFTDAGENLAISVLGIDSARGTATVHIGPRLPALLYTTATITPRPNAAGWNNSPVDVDLAASAVSGTSVSSITTSATGADPKPTTTHPGRSARVRVAAQGRTNVVYAARDTNGVGELPRQLAVNIDTTAPVTSAVRTRTGGTNTIRLTANDAGGSGFKHLQYLAIGADPVPLTTTTSPTATITLTAPGATTVYYWSTDKADNVEWARAERLGPVPVVTPSSLDFFSPPGVTSTPRTVVLRNDGTTALSVKGVGSTDWAFTVAANSSSPCGATLLPNASCRIDVIFTPAALVAYQGSLEILTDAPNPVVRVPLTGVGEPAQLSFTPASMSFPLTLLRSTSPSQTAMIRNPGRVPLILHEVTPGFGGEFQLTADRCGPYPRTLQPGGSCEVDVAFTPLYGGARQGGLMVRSNVPGPMPVLPLTGDGLAQPELTATPSDVSFGDQPVGISGAPARIEMTNTGTAPMQITATTIGGPHAQDVRIVGGTCRVVRRPVVLEPEQSCDLVVQFQPSDLGGRAATLDVTSDAPGPTSVVTLEGHGIAAGEVTFDPTPVAFADQPVGSTSASTTIVVTNTSGKDVELRQVVLDGRDADEFAIVDEKCTGATLATGATCAVRIEFSPLRIGPGTATLVVTDAARARHETLVQGTGTGGRVAFEPAAVDFGPSPVGATERRDVEIRNIGNAQMTVTGVSFTSADFQGTQWCVGARIVPGGSCTMRVAFTPSAAGARQGELLVSSTAPDSPAQLPLTGVGTVAEITLGATALTLGDHAVGTVSPAQSVTVASTGAAPLSVRDVTVTGAHPGDFALTENCSFRGHAPGATCTVTVTFRPTSTGSRAAAVTINSNAAGGPHSVTLAGSGT